MFHEEERRLKYLHWILWYGGHCDLVRAISGNWWRQKLDQGRMKNAQYVRNQRLWELSAVENFVYKGKESNSRGCWGVERRSFPETIYLKAICGLQNLRKMLNKQKELLTTKRKQSLCKTKLVMFIRQLSVVPTMVEFLLNLKTKTLPSSSFWKA